MLNFKFRNALDEVIRNGIKDLATIEELNERLKKAWKYDDEYNFMYGQTVGFYRGIARKMFRDSYDIEPDSEEIAELDEIIESHASELRKALEKLRK